MVLEKLRSRITGRIEPGPPSEEAIRAHVLGEIHPAGSPFPPSSTIEPGAPRAAPLPRGRYGGEFEGEKPAPPVEHLAPPSIEDFPRIEREPPMEAPREFRQRLDERGLYEIMDRLAVIETQLATIRAQNETLNERMKTFELYLRSRMPRSGF